MITVWIKYYRYICNMNTRHIGSYLICDVERNQINMGFPCLPQRITPIHTFVMYCVLAQGGNMVIYLVDNIDCEGMETVG